MQAWHYAHNPFFIILELITNMEFDDYNLSDVDMDAVMKAVMPKLVKNRNIIITSTPSNKDNYFSKLWRENQ